MKALDKQIIDYLPLLNVKQKRAILAVMKVFVDSQDITDHWKDPAFVKEMNRRVAELENGKVKTYTWEEVQARVERRIKKSK